MTMKNPNITAHCFLGKMPVNKLMKRCEKYIGEYLSKPEAVQFEKAYRSSDYSEARHILEKTLKMATLQHNSSDIQKVENMVSSEFSDTEKLLKNGESCKRRQDNTMTTNNSITPIVFILIAILVITAIGAVLYFKVKNKTVGEILSSTSHKNGNEKKKISYSEKDRDMLKLIHELSLLYDNTESYLKKS